MKPTTRMHLTARFAAWALAGAVLGAPLLAAAQATIVVDNASPDFRTTGSWSSSTSGSPFVGGDHLVANAPAAGRLIDNTSPQFSVSGNWTSSTSPGPFYGTDFARSVRGAGSVSPNFHLPEVVVDNTTSGKGGNTLFGPSETANWVSSTALPGYYGRNYLYRSGPTSVEPVAQFKFSVRGYSNIGNASSMVLYAHWPADAGNASNAVVRVRACCDAGAPAVGTFVVNQRVASGAWKALGTVTLNPGASYVVEFDATNANGRVIADAIRLATQDISTPNFAKWTLPGGLGGAQDIYARWPSSSDFETFVAWTAVGGDGSDNPTISMSQKARGGEWVKVGTVNALGSQSNHVLLEQYDSGASSVAADAVAVVPQGSFPTAVWPVNSTGPVTLYATWSADASRTSSALYVVSAYSYDSTSLVACTRTTTSVSVDQRDVASSAGYELGTFDSTSNSLCPPLTVALMPNSTDGTLSADSIRAVPSARPPSRPPARPPAR